MAYNEDVNINLNVLAGAMGGITAIMGGMSALTSTFGQFGTTAVDSFGTFDGLLVSATALIGTFALESANAAGEFEQSMKIVQTVSGQTGSAIQQLGEQANQLSVEYRTAIGDITEGLQTLGRAGLNSADSQLQVLESGLQTAKLEGRNLNGVLEELIQNTAMLGGNLDAIDFGSQTEYVNSLLVGTSMTAPINSHDISQTLQYVGGTAAAAGANLEDKEKLEDLMGTIAAFAQKGVTGSMAGTALRAFLTKPASQDKSVVDGLSAIGLAPEDLWENGGESMKDISDQIELIKHQMDKLNLSTMDQLEIWGKIVGPKMGQQMMKLEADKIDELKGNIQEAASAEELATATLHSYNQKVSEMGQLGELAFRNFGAKVVMYLNPVVDVINTILDLLGNPVINTVAFIGIGALISHGIQKAISMIRTLVSQIRGAISEVVSGIRTINTPMNESTSSANRFKAEIFSITEAVGMMNANLAETNTLTGAMQAHLLGKTGSGMIKGYGLLSPSYQNQKTLPKNVVGLSDNYTQYFSKPQMTRTYTGTLPRNAEQLNADMVAFSKFKQKMFSRGIYDHDTIMKGAVGSGVISAPLSKTGGALDKAPLLPATISEEEYKALSKADKKRFTANNPYYTDAGYKYITTGEYNELDKESKGKYRSQNYRLMAHSGTFEQMNREIDQSVKNLRTFNGTPEEWKKLSPGERLAIQRETEEFRRAKAQELKKDAVYAGKNAAGKDVYGYTTMHNIPKPLTLSQMMSREGAQKGMAMSSAAQKELGREMISTYNKNLGIMGKATQSTFRKIGNYVNTFNKGLSTAQKGISRIGTAASNAKTRVTSFARGLQTEGTGVRAALRGLKSSLRQGATSIKTSLIGFRNALTRNIGSTIMNGVGWTIKQSLTGALSGVKTSLALFSSQLGLSSTALQNLGVSFTAQAGIVSEMGLEFESVNALVAYFAEELGISNKQFVQLIMSSEELSGAFAILAKETTGASAAQASKTMSDIASQGGKLSQGFSGIVGLLGGPFSAALLGVTAIVQVVQGSMQAWQKEMQEATTQLQEATSNMKEASENIKELFKEENPNATEAQLEAAVDAQYASIGEGLYRNSYDDLGNYKPVVTGHQNSFNLNNLGRSEVDDVYQTTAEGVEETVEGLTLSQDNNIKALNDNTVALAEATYAYNQAEGKTVDAMTDAVWGLNSYGSNFTDKLGELQEELWNVGAWANGIDGRAGFLDHGSPVLTGSQKDDNYAGSKEFAGIFAADVYRFGTEQGLRQFFGSDYDRIISLMQSIDNNVYSQSALVSQGPYETLKTHANNMKALDNNGNIDYATSAQMQSQLKNNKSSYQRLGRQMYNYEKQYGFSESRTAYGDWNTGTKRVPIQDRHKKGNAKKEYKALAKEKWTTQDKQLDNTIKKLMAMSDNKLSYANVLAMGQLQQLQDMYQVANEQVAPGIQQTVQQVAQNVMATTGAASNAGSAAGGAAGAASNAAIIASILGAQAQGWAEESAYKQYLRDSDPNHQLQGVKSQEDFVKAISAGGTEAAKYWRNNVYATLGGSAYSLDNPEASQDDIKSAGNRRAQEVIRQQEQNHTNYQDALNTLTRPIVSYAQGATLASYEASDIGKYGSNTNPSGSGGGGSGDGGSGSGDKEKNTKNRVDLVLCNKKEIPKLNVNLFKKEPNFTVLNKNFKLRDIKINTQDTPKSILSAVKNGIIDTAKRMDPKIIQDGESVYDPVGASEGKDTPSGTTPTSS